MQYRIPKMTGGGGKGLLMNDACGQATIFVALVATCDPPSLPCRGFLWGVKSRSPNRNAAGLVLVVAPSRVFFGGGFLLRALPPRAFLLAPPPAPILRRYDLGFGTSLPRESRGLRLRHQASEVAVVSRWSPWSKINSEPGW